MAEDDDLGWEQRLQNLNPAPELSMVVIRDSPSGVTEDFSVFPPNNHENLRISSSDEDDNRNPDSPSPSSSMSPSSSRSAASSSFSLAATESDERHPWTVSDLGENSSSKVYEFIRKSPRKESDSSIEVANGIQKWLKILYVFLQSKNRNISSWLAGCVKAAAGGKFRSFFVVIPAAASLIWWWMQVRARHRRYKEEKIDHLRKVINERDEKIIELLHQIAQMNSLLIKCHKAVAS